MTSLLEMQQEFLNALHHATQQGAIVWHRVRDEARDPNYDRDIYSAEIDGAGRLEIEFVMFEVNVGGAYERALAVVSGLKTYFRVGVGTPGYDTIEDMLSFSIPEWDAGHPANKKALASATAKVRALVDPNG